MIAELMKCSYGCAYVYMSLLTDPLISSCYLLPNVYRTLFTHLHGPRAYGHGIVNLMGPSNQTSSLKLLHFYGRPQLNELDAMSPVQKELCPIILNGQSSIQFSSAKQTLEERRRTGITMMSLQRSYQNKFFSIINRTYLVRCRAE